MGTVNNSLHLVEQRNRVREACAGLNRLMEDVRALPDNPECLVRWQFAQENAARLLALLVEGAKAEELKRVADVEAAFAGRSLFPVEELEPKRDVRHQLALAILEGAKS